MKILGIDIEQILDDPFTKGLIESTLPLNVRTAIITIALMDYVHGKKEPLIKLKETLKEEEDKFDETAYFRELMRGLSLLLYFSSDFPDAEELVLHVPFPLTNQLFRVAASFVDELPEEFKELIDELDNTTPGVIKKTYTRDEYEEKKKAIDIAKKLKNKFAELNRGKEDKIH